MAWQKPTAWRSNWRRISCPVKQPEVPVQLQFFQPPRVGTTQHFSYRAILATILGLDLDDAKKTQTIRAFNKLLWLQNDLINRHYASPPSNLS